MDLQYCHLSNHFHQKRCLSPMKVLLLVALVSHISSFVVGGVDTANTQNPLWGADSARHFSCRAVSIKQRYKDVFVLVPGALRCITGPARNGYPVMSAAIVCLFVGCLTSQQQASVSQGRICSDNFTCCHTEIEVADQTFYLTQSQYTDTGPTSPSADPTTPGAWQGSHWSANF